jgi:hypothetical protein
MLQQISIDHNGRTAAEHKHHNLLRTGCHQSSRYAGEDQLLIPFFDRDSAWKLNDLPLAGSSKSATATKVVKVGFARPKA